MAVRILAGFDGSQTTMVARCTESGGTPAFDVDMTGTYAHETMAAYGATSGYTAFGAALKARLEALNPGARTYTVTYSTTLGTYTIAVNTGTFKLEYSMMGTAGTNFMRAIGHTADMTTVASKVSDVKCYYVIHTGQGCKSEVTDDYEPDSYIQGGVSDSGRSYGVSPTALPKQYDFRIPFETKALTYTRSAAAAVPWTHQHLFEHCRAAEPIMVVDDVETAAHFLRPDDAHWKPERAFADYDNAWHVNYKTYVHRS